MLETIVSRSLKGNLKAIIAIIVGGTSVLIITAGYFAAHHALDELWDAAFRYNYFYTTGKVGSTISWVQNFLDVRILRKTGLYYFLSLGLASFLVTSHKKKAAIGEKIPVLLAIAVIDIPLELILINLPGTTYAHYFMTILPAAAVLSDYVFHLVDKGLSQPAMISLRSRWILAAATIGFFALSNIADYRSVYYDLAARINENRIHYISENTNPGDPVLLWGTDAMVNYHTARVSPTRFVSLPTLQARVCIQRSDPGVSGWDYQKPAGTNCGYSPSRKATAIFSHC